MRPIDADHRIGELPLPDGQDFMVPFTGILVALRKSMDESLLGRRCAGGQRNRALHSLMTDR